MSEKMATANQKKQEIEQKQKFIQVEEKTT
jgi:hypothetical protein